MIYYIISHRQGADPELVWIVRDLESAIHLARINPEWSFISDDDMRDYGLRINRTEYSRRRAQARKDAEAIR